MTPMPYGITNLGMQSDTNNAAAHDTIRPDYVTRDTERCPAPEAAICENCTDDLLAEEPGPHCAYCTEALAHMAERETQPDLSQLADPECSHCRGQGQTYSFTSEEDPGELRSCSCVG